MVIKPRRRVLEKEPQSSSQSTAYPCSCDDLLYDLLPRWENQQKGNKPNYWIYENWSLIYLELRPITVLESVRWKV